MAHNIVICVVTSTTEIHVLDFLQSAQSIEFIHRLNSGLQNVTLTLVAAANKHCVVSEHVSVSVFLLHTLRQPASQS